MAVCKVKSKSSVWIVVDLLEYFYISLSKSPTIFCLILYCTDLKSASKIFNPSRFLLCFGFVS